LDAKAGGAILPGVAKRRAGSTARKRFLTENLKRGRGGECRTPAKRPEEVSKTVWGRFFRSESAGEGENLGKQKAVKAGQ